MDRKKYMIYAMLCGILGCFCYGGGDWLMMYGDPTYVGDLFWLTEGVVNIASWRNTLAMVLAFPGIILYGIALFALKGLVIDQKRQKCYGVLTAFGLTPWLALHLFYIMVLYLYAWLNGHGYAEQSTEICETLYNHLSWIVMVSEAVMLPPFIYWFWIVLRGNTMMPKTMAIVNPLVFYFALYIVRCIMPQSAFRIGFTNGLMSESMIVCFIIWAIWIWHKYKKQSMHLRD